MLVNKSGDNSTNNRLDIKQYIFSSKIFRFILLQFICIKIIETYWNYILTNFNYEILHLRA